MTGDGPGSQVLGLQEVVPLLLRLCVRSEQQFPPCPLGPSGLQPVLIPRFFFHLRLTGLAPTPLSVKIRQRS